MTTWNISTTINPTAWSPTVERDLATHVAYAFFMVDPDTLADVAPADAFLNAWAAMADPLKKARKLLARKSGPHEVALSDTDVMVEPAAGIPTPKQHAAREALLEAQRVEATSGN